MHRRLVTTAIKGLSNNENGSGSAPNILEHPDMKTPIVMENHPISFSSSSASSISPSNKKITRQQSGKRN